MPSNRKNQRTARVGANVLRMVRTARVPGIVVGRSQKTVQEECPEAARITEDRQGP